MLPMLPADKANHVLYGGVIFIAIAYLAAVVGHSPARARLAGLLAAAAFGLGKEARDWFANRKAVAAGEAPEHNVDSMDVVATAVGGALCWLATLAVQG
jgi:hypothetical protein